MTNTKNIKKDLDKITDTVDVDTLNRVIKMDGTIETLTITKKTLRNIAQWALDGKSQFEIAQNLELTSLEWDYLKKICPAILLVMEHSQAYADVVIAGTIFQTAVGGQIVKKKVPMKVKDYNSYGKVIGEHYENVEIEETTQPNPYLLKYLAEHKLSEKLGDKVVDNSAEHRKIIDNMTEEELKIIKGEN